MSKFLKIIVNIMLLLGIVSAGALVIPPLMGVTTVVSDGTGSTNLTRGSVTYAKNEAVGQIAVGDKILVDNSTGEFVYEVQGINEDGTTFLVQDKVSGETSDQVFQGKISKVMLTVPVIGYVSMAAQSKEGMLMIILAIVFLVILFILSEVWKEDEEEDEDDEDEEEDDQEEENDAWDEAVIPSEDEEDTADTVVRMLSEELSIPEEAQEEVVIPEELKETSEEEQTEAEPEEKKEMPLETQTLLEEEVLIDSDGLAGLLDGEEEAPEEKSASPVQEQSLDEQRETDSAAEKEQDPMEKALEESLEVALNTPSGEENSSEPQITGWMEEPEEEAPAAEEQEEVIELAIPIYTAQELLEKAHAAGDDPRVIEDPQSGVTILDYSDII
ncbi:MAG: hypothetical protein SOT28_07070 [Fusicatenibacter sp.]|nr:hypothetical protein [Fusicatenibacter sp.]